MSGIISGKEIEAPEEVKKVLEFGENVLYGFQQAGIGGKITGLESIFVTNKRIIKMKPKTLGLRADVTDYLFKDMANVKLDKGILRSSIAVIMRFQSENIHIKDIPKDGANKIFKTIQDGIAGRLEPNVYTNLVSASPKIDITEQIKKLKELKDSGLITDDEFETKRKDLLSRM